MKTAQGRYSAGLAPFEGETDVSHIPWAPRTDEQPSSSERMSSLLSNTIRSRRPFSSGATDEDIDPVTHITQNLIPSSPTHGTVQSGVRQRRQFASGASDEYVELKSARFGLERKVKETIDKRRDEQPRLVGQLARLWDWTNAEIGDTSEETQYRLRQLPQIEQLIVTIEANHHEGLRRLTRQVTGTSTKVGSLLKANYELLSGNGAWWNKYQSADELLRIVKGDKASQTRENLLDLCGRWTDVLAEAEKAITSATSTTSTALKIGYNPFDTNDSTTVYDYYQQTGGLALKGHVLTVCQQADKAGGKYTYQGKVYDMFHDSHGPNPNTGGNSAESRTAWKILIDGKLQVVGVGRHIKSKGAPKYQAIFPYSTDPTVKEYGASPNITDSRN